MKNGRVYIKRITKYLFAGVLSFHYRENMIYFIMDCYIKRSAEDEE